MELIVRVLRRRIAKEKMVKILFSYYFDSSVDTTIIIRIRIRINTNGGCTIHICAKLPCSPFPPVLSSWIYHISRVQSSLHPRVQPLLFRFDRFTRTASRIHNATTVNPGVHPESSNKVVCSLAFSLLLDL